jgi:PLP dependent protein
MSTNHNNNNQEVDMDVMDLNEHNTVNVVASNLQQVRDSIKAVCHEIGQSPTSSVRLVAVSKTKPIVLLQQAYEEGQQRIFGENYVQELVEKAAEMSALYKNNGSSSKEEEEDIVWHFIGALQSNKVNMLVKGVVPYGTLVVETVSSIKIANKLDLAMTNLWQEQEQEQESSTTTITTTTRHPPVLSVFVQVNTSGEDTKSGVTPEQAIDLCRHIVQKCPHLSFMGLMTIGARGDASDFQSLVQCRLSVAHALQVDPSSIELSMGMSDDYQEAIRYGATSIRVGSTIFGTR